MLRAPAKVTLAEIHKFNATQHRCRNGTRQNTAGSPALVQMSHLWHSTLLSAWPVHQCSAPDTAGAQAGRLYLGHDDGQAGGAKQSGLASHVGSCSRQGSGMMWWQGTDRGMAHLARKLLLMPQSISKLAQRNTGMRLPSTETDMSTTFRRHQAALEWRIRLPGTQKVS